MEGTVTISIKTYEELKRYKDLVREFREIFKEHQNPHTYFIDINVNELTKMLNKLSFNLKNYYPKYILREENK